MMLLPIVATLTAAQTESPSYSKQGNALSFHNTPHRNGVVLNTGKPTPIAQVAVRLKEPTDVLVLFTSQINADTSEGCPCTVRATLHVNDQEPIIIKRVNLGSAAVAAISKYDRDRQSVDGSYVFSLPPGDHTISLTYLQMDGSSKELRAYYLNLQAIPFANR